MYDDIPLSASEKTPDQRHDGAPPAWWRDLARTDLPRGPGEAAFTDMRATHERAAMIQVIGDRAARGASGPRVLAMVAVLIGGFAVLTGASSPPIRVVGALAVAAVLLRHRVVRSQSRLRHRDE